MEGWSSVIGFKGFFIRDGGEGVVVWRGCIRVSIILGFLSGDYSSRDGNLFSFDYFKILRKF